ncbi:MAG: hypothetical protein SPK37_00050 [Candidatus Limisoma sp.]|nr:hypothetical protein [Candidatus Limisoma sp.]
MAIKKSSAKRFAELCMKYRLRCTKQQIANSCYSRLPALITKLTVKPKLLYPRRAQSSII